MSTWQTGADGSVTCEHGTMKPPRACAVCAASALPDEDPTPPGFYERLTDEANEAGLPDRVAAERILWDRHAMAMQIAADLGAEAALVDEQRKALDAAKATNIEQAIEQSRLVRDLVGLRSTLLSLQIKAIDVGGKDARHATTLILWRERKADTEVADRLYADRQRKVGRKREVH